MPPQPTSHGIPSISPQSSSTTTIASVGLESRRSEKKRTQQARVEKAAERARKEEERKQMEKEEAKATVEIRLEQDNIAPIDLSTSSITRRHRKQTMPLHLEDDVPVPIRSSLMTARYIEKLQDIEYPEGVNRPGDDLNKDAKIRYDRDFLLQFMHVSKGKPPGLPPLDILGIEPSDQSASSMTCGGTGRHHQSTPVARKSSVELGLSGGSGAKPGAVPNPKRRQQEALKPEQAQLQVEEGQDIAESPTENFKEREEGEATSGEIQEPQVDCDSTMKPPNALKEALQIDPSSMSPPPEFPRRRSGPLDVNAEKRDLSAPPRSALATARNIEVLQDIEYPEGVKGPREDLNKDAKYGKFRYDRDFLMQFKQICKEKPPNLPPLDILGIEPVDLTAFNIACGSLGRHRQPASAMSPTAPQSSVGLGISSGFGAKPGAAPGPFPMGQFSTPTSKLTSEERYLLSTAASVSSSSAAMQFRPMTASQGEPGGHSMGSNRTRTKRIRTKRGDRRTDANKVALSQQGEGSGFGAPGSVPTLRAALEPVTPLEISANRWVAMSTVRKPGSSETSESLELQVGRKVKALLNKLTMEKFDSISDQIIGWMNKSEKENDARAQIQVIRLVCDRAADQAVWSGMYARLCRKMMETISPEVRDDGIRNSEGKPIAGGQLFRKYLANRCQENFERSWVTKETTVVATFEASNGLDVNIANENENYYYPTRRAQCRGFGLVKFAGELFKVQMLAERIMHKYVKMLLGNVENPKEDNIESLCGLLNTIGRLLDVPKARAHMDMYFTRMKELSERPDVSPRMQFMLLDVIELRDRKWVARSAITKPTNISPLYQAEATSRRGGNRTAYSGPRPDGWTTAGGSVTRSQPKAGDLSQFGKISKPASMVMGPSSVFKKKDTKRDSL